MNNVVVSVEVVQHGDVLLSIYVREVKNTAFTQQKIKQGSAFHFFQIIAKSSTSTKYVPWRFGNNCGAVVEPAFSCRHGR